tara:strand:+ start:38086 stop:38208 length:123 start_codon:yes stop_codon:yes gene_type:complete
MKRPTMGAFFMKNIDGCKKHQVFINWLGCSQLSFIRFQGL